MTTYSWIVLSLGAVDVLIVTLWFLFLRSKANLDRKSRIITGIALLGFIFHAVMFFEGPFLYLQLATIAGVYIGLALRPATRQAADGDRGQGVIGDAQNNRE